MIRSRAVVALAVSLVAVLPTAGCYQGFDNTVNTQGPTGNGTDFLVGPDIKVQDATLVTGPEGQSGVASLVMTLVNEGEMPDALVKVSTEPATTSSQRIPIAVKSGASVQVGGPGCRPDRADRGVGDPGLVRDRDLQLRAGRIRDPQRGRGPRGRLLRGVRTGSCSHAVTGAHPSNL